MSQHQAPCNVGILAIEIYFPRTYVDQDALEEYDKISKGKYTIGLGQTEMSFCCDNEDINSLCLTVVSNLMQRHQLNYKDIGRLEVGTETIIDKSKSVKTVLMNLFEESGNFDVEGVDTSNACYGGTSALFNAAAWVESSSWDGRMALVVCGDIAVYASGPARCTGGAGAVAMLVGPYAPLVIESGLRGSHMKHAYDFYKPDLTSEYPVVDGKLSVECYTKALDSCYQLYCKKAISQLNLSGRSFSFHDIDYMLFHCPFAKLVQKSVARIVLNDVVHGKTSYYAEEFLNDLASVQKHKMISLHDNIFNREVEKELMTSSKKLFEQKTFPSLFIAKKTGNMYTPSLYSCLVSLLTQISPENLVNKRIGLFSYGSGLASSMFSLRVSGQENNFVSAANVSYEKFNFQQLVSSLSDVLVRLKSRHCVDPATFSAALKRREETHRHANYKPQSSTEYLFPGTYYLVEVDEKFRRTYACKN